MAIVRKVTTKDGISWKVDYYDPQGRRIKKRFKKKAEAEAYLAKVVTSIKEEKYEDIFEKKKGSQPPSMNWPTIMWKSIASRSKSCDRKNSREKAFKETPGNQF
jgi:hypothetical protein